MFRNNLKARLAEGRVPVGHMIWEFGTRGMASMAEAAGLDFVLIDMEHGPFSAAQVADLIAWFRGTSVTPMVRVPMPEYHFIARMLDAGALGIMTPNVQDGATARHIAQSVRYAPAGRRGLGLGGSVSGYEAVDFRSFMDASNEAVTIINQIESQEGLDNLEEMEIEVNQDLLDLADHRVHQDHKEVLDPEEIQDHVVNEERPDNQATMELQVRKYFKALKVFLHEF